MNKTQELLEKKAEERYYKEHERNAQINNSLSIPIAIIVALLGVVGFLLVNIPFKIVNTPIAWVFLGWFIVGLITLIVYLVIAIYFLHKVFLGLRYVYISSPRLIRDYAERLEKYYGAKYYGTQQAQDIDETVERDVREFLVNAYSKSTDNNIKLNVEKGFYLTEAKKYIILALVFLMIASIPFVALHYREKNLREDVQKVKIIGDIDG